MAMLPRQPSATGPTTPYRVTHIVLDEDRPTILEPPFALQRHYKEIATGYGALLDNIVCSDNIGYRLKSFQDDQAEKRMTEEGNGGILGSGFLAIAPNHEFTPTFAKVPDGTYAANVVDEGDEFLYKKLPAGTDPEQKLDSDMGTIPPPFPEEDPQPMDRIAVSTFETQKYQRNFEFVIQAPSTSSEVSGPIANFYFPANPSRGLNYYGAGYFAIKVWGSGNAYVFEYGWSGSEWKWFFIGNFGGNVLPPTGNRWTIRVEVVETQNSEYPFGGFVIHSNLIPPEGQSKPTNSGIKSALYDSRSGSKIAQKARTDGFWDWKCLNNPNGPDPEEPPEGVGYLRVDVNRDTRPGTQISRLTYASEGHLVDGDFKLPFIVTTEEKISIGWYGQLPSGCSITPRLFRSDTNAEIPADALSDFLVSFLSIPGVNQYYPRFDFVGTTDATPTLEAYVVTRNGVAVTVSPGEFELEIGPEVFETDESGTPTEGILSEAVPDGRLEIIKPGADPSIEVATFGVHDLTRIHDRITKRSWFTSRIEVEYVPEDSNARCVLHRGYVVGPEGRYSAGAYTEGRAVSTPGYASGRVFWSLTSPGMWEKLNRALSPCRWDWGAPDPSADPLPDGAQPSYKATDAVRAMLVWAGFPLSMISIPDLPIRLWASNGVDFHVEPLSSLADMIMRIVRKYLGMRLVFCENAGLYGKWRVLEPTLPPYTPLLHFTTVSQPAGSAAMRIDSYPEIEGRPVVPVKGQTLRPFNIPLEANRIIVTACGDIGGAKGQMARMTQIWHNHKSFNFHNLDPSHVNFPDPLHPDWCPEILEAAYIDPGLTDRDFTGYWVGWALRRIASIAGHTVRGYTFDAPLALIDAPGDEELVGKVRIPRYYDACTFNGVDFLVRSCNPYFTKDGHQMARYEIEAPREDYL